MPTGLDFFCFQSVIKEKCFSHKLTLGPTKMLCSVDGVIWINLVTQSVIYVIQLKVKSESYAQT